MVSEKFGNTKMNDKIKILVIFIIIAIVTVCGTLVMQKSKTNETPKNPQQKTETPQVENPKPEVPQKPVSSDENNIPKSDYKVPEIG